MTIHWLDIVLIAPSILTLIVFALLHFFGEGDSGKGYTVLGSKSLGNAVFLYMVSLVVIGPVILGCLVWGIWRVIARLLA